ncbi:replication protein P [Plesiomonas shigelloides]|uniref:replication protein P n=1 Tax=Plesiomonas shigelloides TaxID=703 RepID=UPI00387F19E3
MKNLNRAIQHRDASALSRLMPAANHDHENRVVNPQAEQLVDVLFRSLKQIFPAAAVTVLRNPADEADTKRQWIAAFAENGITTKEQIAAGMRKARTVDSDFWPSVGKFIAWCNAGTALSLGLPAVDDVMCEFERYNARHYDYQNPESFPWSSPVMYWIVLDMRRSMYQYNKTAGEMRKVAEQCLIGWEKKLRAGESVPAPVVQIANKSRPVGVSQQMDRDGRYKNAGRALLERIRAGRATA